MGISAAVAKACVSAPAPSGHSAPISAQRPCIPRSVRARGRAAPVLLSSVRSRYRRATLPPCPGFLVSWSAWAHPLGPGARCPRVPRPEREPEGRRPAVRPSWCAPGCSKPLPRPTWERRGGVGLRGSCQRPRPLCSQALPRCLPGRRRRHTWGAQGSKLGGDVNGPGQTSPRTSRVGWRKGGADPAAAAQ